MPAYNSAQYISESIKSVLSQTYQNWELIIVDDSSTDNTASIVEEFKRIDKRILYYKTDKPSGSPTLPRNMAIEKAKGRYIAFLDSDDLWLPRKLEEQLAIIVEPNVGIVFSNYRKINHNGEQRGKIISSPSILNYQMLLKGSSIGCLTAMYDTFKVGKVFMEYIKAEDYALWLTILKMGTVAKNTNSTLALYRVHEGSVSSNKLQASVWTWNILRHKENLSIIYALYCFVHYAVKAVIKKFK